jgi:hypothetical protein
VLKSDRDEWVLNLRNGKYPQGKTYLKYEGKFCCLGVLCEVLPFLSKTDSVVSPYEYKDGALLGNSSMDPFGKSLELENQVGLPLEDVENLIRMNDEGVDFRDIADWIEGNVETTSP